METNSPATAPEPKVEMGCPPRSPSIMKLMKALALVQKEMKPAAFDSENPHHKSKYASLTAVYEASKPLLIENNLGVIQIVETAADGSTWIETTLMHYESGEYISSRLKLALDKNNMQGLGSAITYARRYLYSVIVGVVSDQDDDGNSAAGKPGAPNPAGRNAQNQKGAPQGKADAAKKPTPAQLKAMAKEAEKQGWAADDIKKCIQHAFKKKSSQDITLSEFQYLEQWTKQWAPDVAKTEIDKMLGAKK